MRRTHLRPYRVALEADQHRPDHPNQDHDVVQFLDDTLDIERMHHVTTAQIDDPEPAPCTRTLLRETASKGNPVKLRFSRGFESPTIA